MQYKCPYCFEELADNYIWDTWFGEGIHEIECPMAHKKVLIKVEKGRLVGVKKLSRCERRVTYRDNIDV